MMKSTQSRVSGVAPQILGPGSWFEISGVIAAFILVGAITFGVI